MLIWVSEFSRFQSMISLINLYSFLTAFLQSHWSCIVFKIEKTVCTLILYCLKVTDISSEQKLKNLFSYYCLHRETFQFIRSFFSSNLNFDFKSEAEYIEKHFHNVIESNSRDTVFILRSYLDIDCDAFHDWVTQYEFQTTIVKRSVKESVSERRVILKIDENFISFYLERQYSDSENKRTHLNWKIDFEEFRKTIAHFWIRDRFIESCFSQRSEKETISLKFSRICDSLTEKISSLDDNTLSVMSQH